MRQQAKAQPSKHAAPTTVEEYLAAVPAGERAELERVRAIIRGVVPDATEVISYGMPMFRHNGRMLVAYGARKGGGSLYGMSAGLQTTHAAALKAVEFAAGTKGTVHFSAKKPLSAAAVKALVRARIDEVAARRPAKVAVKRAAARGSAKPAAKRPVAKRPVAKPAPKRPRG